ncbi:MAG: CvpA family protein [Deltaproteobacteria bacterium]|nr:CvpA family protein [Deltaproteobacteria bacterium]
MLNSLDVIIILIIMGGALWGYFRGLLAEIIALVGVFVGIFSASHFYLLGAEVLLPLLRAPKLTTFIAFLILYLLSVLAFFLIHLLIKSNMAGGAIGPVSRICAALVGGLKSTVFITMIIFLVIFFWGSGNLLTSGSKLLPRFLPHCQPVVTLMPETMQEPLNEYLGELTATNDDAGTGEVVK